jgi:hypothetical protein
METSIKNIVELQSEIARLKTIELQQAAALKIRFSGPSATFGTLLTMFPKSATVDGIKGAGFFHQDFLGLISRFVLPLTLNKTLFKNSNFIIKALVGILSQKASGYISEDSVTSVWSKAKGLFSNMFKRKETVHEVPVPVVVVTTDDIPPYQAY